MGGDAPVLAEVSLPRGFLRRPDAISRLRRMMSPNSPGGPALEGAEYPSCDAEFGKKAAAALPGFWLADDFEEDDEPAAPLSASQWVVAHRRMAARDPSKTLGPITVVAYRLPADPLDALLYGAALAGSLLCDGIGDAVMFGGPHEPERLLEMVLGVLQACRLRASRTEYIACPGCGRTLFDLESTTQRIKARTGHLPGVKIAVMGCIVNGPGEMADADFGYVGAAPGFVNLYVGKDIVERSVPQAEADERLIELLKKHGVWREPAPAV